LYFYSERVGTNQTFYAAWSTMLWAGAQQVAWTPDMIHTGYLPSWQALGSNHYWLTPFETTWLIRLEEGTYPLTIHWRGYSADLMYKAHLGRQDIQVVRLY
jgi:hypothetical protein